MADYWKSLPKKYCDFCKCWITDNKSSVDFHEKGLKHQGNVQRRLDELRKKGEVDHRRQQEMNTDLKRMEEAAMRAYHKDLTSNPDLTARNMADKHTHVAKVIESAAANPKTYKSGEDAALKAAASLGPGCGPGPSLPLLPAPKVWHEVQTPEGHSYYWNIDTQETTWEVPAEGFVSILEQQLEELKNCTEGDSLGASAQAILKKKKKKKKKIMFEHGFTTSVTAEDEAEARREDEEAAEAATNPYGQWQTVEPKVEPEPVDLQLPRIKFSKPVVPAASVPEEPAIKFREKTLAPGASGIIKREPGESEFKKRKLHDEVKKNMRQRDSGD